MPRVVGCKAWGVRGPCGPLPRCCYGSFGGWALLATRFGVSGLGPIPSAPRSQPTMTGTTVWMRPAQSQWKLFIVCPLCCSEPRVLEADAAAHGVGAEVLLVGPGRGAA